MPLKVFISYSHKNEVDKNEFIKHLSPLVDKKDIEIWHDKEMLLGTAFNEKIKNEINKSDVICLMLSADYLNSTACKNEKNLAFEIKKKRYIDIVPIIISDCGWKEYPDIYSILAPNDGKPVYDYDNRDKAWNIIYEELKKVIENAKNISELELSDTNKNFLNNADLLANAHADKRTVFLDDIFVYPNLAKIDEVTRKWISMNKEYDNNDNYKLIDTKTEFVDNLFKKTMGKGGLQSYPFFILSLLNIYETTSNKLDAEFTSQGHCYQTLIYLYLKKENVKNEDVDMYFNFLSEIANYLFEKNIKELVQMDFTDFWERYEKNYNAYIGQKILLKTLHNSKIFLKNNLNNYVFEHDYLYYYFIAKYLSEHIESKLDIIKNMIANLHKKENAYILILLFHHTKNDEVIEELLKAAKFIFNSIDPISLKKDELKFIDERIKYIIAEAILPENLNPEKEREKRLDFQQDIEDIDIEDKEELLDNDSTDDPVLELRKGIKTIEVIGQIAKNRAGSLKRQKIKEILTDGIDINLRIFAFLLNTIKEQEEQIIDFISAKLRLYMRHKNIENEQLKKYATRIFWSLPFIATYGIVKNIIHSLGSDKLLDVISELYNENKTPANCLLKHGIFMWYGKNLQLDSIKKEIEEKDFSETAKRIMYFLIVEHCSMHEIKQKEKQMIEEFLGTKPKSSMQMKFERKNKKYRNLNNIW